MTTKSESQNAAKDKRQCPRVQFISQLIEVRFAANAKPSY